MPMECPLGAHWLYIETKNDNEITHTLLSHSENANGGR